MFYRQISIFPFSNWIMFELRKICVVNLKTRGGKKCLMYNGWIYKFKYSDIEICLYCLTNFQLSGQFEISCCGHLSSVGIIQALEPVCCKKRKKKSKPRNWFGIQAVLDRRPKFYGRSRRFQTYGYGYGGRSLRPFLRPKVLLVVFFQNGGWNVFFITQVPL